MKSKRSMKSEAIHGVHVVRATGRKDRHSKVCTARGTRDRRVRLSPKTAILFYDVQDRLGYDRPSKAIDWLINEAKPAIDALDHPHPPPAPAQSNTKILKFECEHSNDQIIPVSGFGAAPPLTEDYQDQFLSAPTPLELFDANSEIVRLQRIFFASAGGEDYSSAPPPNLHMFSERESLQSSYSNLPQFQGFRFSDEELPDFCGGAVATLKEDEIDKIGVLSSSSSFLHYDQD